MTTRGLDVQLVALGMQGKEEKRQFNAVPRAGYSSPPGSGLPAAENIFSPSLTSFYKKDKPYGVFFKVKANVVFKKAPVFH